MFVRTSVEALAGSWIVWLQFTESQFKQTWGLGSTSDTGISTSNMMDECIYQSVKKCSPTLSEGKKSKVSHLKCMYTNGCDMANKQEELEPGAQCEGCQKNHRNLVEKLIWWGDHNGWLQIFPKDKKGRRGAGVVLCVIEIFACRGELWRPCQFCVTNASESWLEGSSLRRMLCTDLPVRMMKPTKPYYGSSSKSWAN